MALVTVQRTPSPHRAQQLQQGDDDEDAVAPAGQARRSRRSQKSLRKLVNTVNTIRFVNRLRFSESYFTIKGAALILPKSDKVPHSKKRTRSKSSVTQVSGIQAHLQSMFHELRADDTIQVAIKLESATECSRYFVIVVTEGSGRGQEGVIIGFHCSDQSAQVGLVLPVYQSTELKLDGDGGFRILTKERPRIFKPISVQAMWSALMALNKVCNNARQNGQIPGGPTHTWLSHYTDKMTVDQTMLNEWDLLDDLMVFRSDGPAADMDSLERQIRTHLREMMSGCDLEELTSLMVRLELEKILNTPLRNHRSFIDQEMILIMRQMDASSEILDFMYLGSEWNASNMQELQANGIGYILNVTREIDNFFPGLFKYMNIRLYDTEDVDLMKHWENTHRFICKARDNNSKILIHCKMGVSRSASTVIAFAMKEYGWSLDKAMQIVKDKRPVIRPNDSFMQQLQTYEGILNASKQRWNPKFKGEAEGREDQTAARDSVLSELSNNDDASSTSDSTVLNPEKHNIDKVEELSTGDSEDDSSSSSSESNSESSDSETCASDSASSGRLEDECESGVTRLRDDLTTVSQSEMPTTSAAINDSSAITASEKTATDLEEVEIRALHPSTSNEKKIEIITNKSASEQSSPHTSSTVTSPSAESQCIAESAGAGPVDDVSVCYGVVQKTKEQIAGGLPANLSTACKAEEIVMPVTPGTVRKVLGEIECKSHEMLSRSASLKFSRTKFRETPESVQRSSSVKEKKMTTSNTQPSGPAQTGCELVSDGDNNNETDLTLSKTQQKTQSTADEEKVKFSIGGDPHPAISSPEPELEQPEKLAPLSTADLDKSLTSTNSCECAQHQRASVLPGCSRTDCMLKISSKANLLPSDEEKIADSSSPLPVRALVGAFEDIGSASRTLNRPLTVHVDSFNSDAFAQNQSSLVSPLVRSQSLQAFNPELEPTPEPLEKKFDIKNVSAPDQKILQPYWKIKRDNTKKLVHSFSTATMGSKDAAM